jgi:hypothetical protein
MTDPAAIPFPVLEAVAHNLCSLHDFDPAFVAAQEGFARAVIAEYQRATRSAATGVLLPHEPTSALLTAIAGTDYDRLPPAKQLAERAAYATLLAVAAETRK